MPGMAQGSKLTTDGEWKMVDGLRIVSLPAESDQSFSGYHGCYDVLPLLDTEILVRTVCISDLLTR